MACILIISDATHLTSSPERLAIHSIFTESRAFLWARGTNASPKRDPPLCAQAPSISLINSYLQPATGAFKSDRPCLHFRRLPLSKSKLSVGAKLTSLNFTPELMNNIRNREAKVVDGG
ncbi:hypothetical protein CEXT_679441 [Caerostris extrusa]|uniref:Uncharacterized protein n=1 Tax=Caerostris extrusa TaxID=172846 RepID=A0AAV4YBI2_CAEEX|nr:hypothetical protein CEXT_679441 [Caerostris extrusa]